MRVSCGSFSSPRQYAPLTAVSLNAPSRPRRGHVRSEAQVLPAVVAVEAGGLGAGRDVARGLLGGETLDDLPLERLVGQAAQRLVAVDVLADERLVLGHDRPHRLLDPGQVVDADVRRDRQVVVEAVGDRRPDAELGARPQPGDRLREHVRGRVAQHVEAVVGAHVDRLDRRVAGRHEGEVTELAVDPRGDRAGRQGAADRLPFGKRHGGAVGQAQGRHALQDSRRACGRPAYS